MLKARIIFLSLIMFFSGITGCGYKVELPNVQVGQSQSQIVVNQVIVEKIKEASTTMTPEDKLIFKKMYLGCSSFISSSIPETSIDVRSMLKNVEIMYGVDDAKKAKNKTHRDMFVKILGDLTLTNEIDYTKSHKIEECRENLKLIFESLAAGL